MGMHRFFESLDELETIDRAPGYFKFEKHSVAAHSFRVAEIAQFFGDVEEKNGNKVNWQSLYEKALNHDYTERFIGDIKTPVKYATSSLRKMLAKVDKDLTENFITNEIPAEFQSTYRRRLSEGKDDTIEGKILSLSDKVDLMYESFGEIQKGNPEKVYLEMYKESLQTILSFRDTFSGAYFLNKILPDMVGDSYTRPKLKKITKHILDKNN